MATPENTALAMADGVAVTFPNSPSAAGRGWILAAVCLAGLVLPLSFAGAAVATPAIGRALGGGPVALTWITNAFMLAFGSFLMAAGALADQYGRKRLFTIGIAAFSIVSLLMGFSPNVLWLDLLRASQGLAAAAALAGGSAALAQEFDGAARTRAFSLLGTTFGVGLAFGPILAGVLIGHFGWRAIFLSGTVIGALSLLLGVPRMRESRDPAAVGLDWPGTLSFTGTLTLFTWGVLQAPERGWSDPVVIGLLICAALLLTAFIVIEWRVARPMLDLSLFRYSRFVGVQVLPIATCYCFVVLLVLLPLRFIGIEGRSEIEAGWMMMALSAPMLIVPMLAAMLTRWFSAGLVSAVGLLIAAAGLFLLSRIGSQPAGHDLLLPLLVIGTGTGLPWGLMDGLSVSVVPKERAGMATGIFSTTRVAGEGIAIALVGAVFVALIQSGLAGAASAADTTAAAQRLATGDLAHAQALMPSLQADGLVRIHAEAFRYLLYGLIAITLISAAILFAMLGRPRKSEMRI